ncbi:MAG: DUF2195 family protein [Gammaproteobacteria bacterium]|nr:MAG: DUF2195 family protein [Gammaproteobacteria bacterium]
MVINRTKRSMLNYSEKKLMLIQTLMFVFFASSCAAAKQPDKIEINNNLSACTYITNTKISTENDIPLLSFDLKIDKPISECGCKSAQGAYTVYTYTENYKSYILGGKIVLMASKHKSLPLSADKNLIDNRKLIIEFSCSQPD